MSMRMLNVRNVEKLKAEPKELIKGRDRSSFFANYVVVYIGDGLNPFRSEVAKYFKALISHFVNSFGRACREGFSFDEPSLFKQP